MELGRTKKILIRATLIIIVVLLAIALIISAYNLINYNIDSDALKSNQKIIENSVIVKNEEKPENRYEIEFDELKKQNDEVVAYLKVFGTNIDCPIVKTKNNNYYLTHGFDKERNILGWPFADYRNNFNGEDKNIIIYGHNLNDGTFFGSLINVLSPSWQNITDNRRILLITEKETKVYEVFSTYEFKPEDYYITTDFKDDEEFSKYLETIKARSNRLYGIEVGQDDHILTLSSCVGTGEARVVLHAKEINNSQP